MKTAFVLIFCSLVAFAESTYQVGVPCKDNFDCKTHQICTSDDNEGKKIVIFHTQKMKIID